MTDELSGPPQIAALLVLIQRGVEEIHSARNMRVLLARGGREEGSKYYASELDSKPLHSNPRGRARSGR